MITKNIWIPMVVLFFSLSSAIGCSGTGENASSETVEIPAEESSPSVESIQTEVGLESDVSAPTTTVQPSPTKTVQPTPTISIPTMTSLPTPTDQPDNALRAEWTIQTGNLQYLGIVADGTIYGLSPNLYAIIDSSGNVVSTAEPDLERCLRSNFSGITGSPDIAQWLAMGTEGTFYSSAGCIISPNQLDDVGDFFQSGGVYLPYALGERYRSAEPVPEGYRFANYDGIDLFPQGPFWIDYRADTSTLQLNDDTLSAGYINNEGQFVQFQLPEIVPQGFRFGVTPWGDTYVLYESFDALGNSTGEVITRIKPDGTQETVDKVPLLFYGTYEDMPRLVPITYLPERGEIYFIDEQKTFLLKFDTALELQAIYMLPADYERFAMRESVAVGNDGNLYFWHLGRNELTKYLIPGQ